MRALVIQPDPDCGPGLVGECLADRGYALDVRQIVPSDAGAAPGVAWDSPDPRDADLVVVLGARWSAYDDETLDPWLGDVRKLLRTAHDAAMPVLGICFGAQALARELGGTVMRAPEPEVGWVHVDSTAPGLVPSGPWFQWHFDRFTPPGATEIARNAAASQAFRVCRSLGVQFHPEVTPEILERWLSDDGGKSAESAGADPDALRSATLAQLPEARRRTYGFVDAFLALTA